MAAGTKKGSLSGAFARFFVLAFRHDRRSQPGSQVVGELVQFGIAVDLDGLLGRIADDEAVVAPLEMFFQLHPCSGVERVVQVVG